MAKLTVISPAIGPYGGWNMFFRLLKYIDSSQKFQKNTTITIITTGKPDHRLEELKSLNLNLYRTKWLNYNKYVHRMEKYPYLNFVNSLPLLIVTLFYMCIRGRKTQNILSNGYLSSIPCIIAKKITKGQFVKIYPWLHTDNRFSEKKLLKWLIRNSDSNINKFFVNSRDIKNDLIECGISDEKIIIINNWIDGLKISEEERIVFHNTYTFLDNYEFIALYMGRFVEYKHFLTYLRVAEITACPMIAFVFIGDGELSDELKKLRSRNKHVYWFKELSDKNVRYLLGKANLTLAYADEYYLGLTAYESLFSGTPVLYVWFSAAPDKFPRKVRISRNILPSLIGYQTSDDANCISSLIITFQEQGFPSMAVRELCINYARKFHSDRNAEKLASYICQT